MALLAVILVLVGVYGCFKNAVKVELISDVDIDVPVIHVNLFKELMRMKGSC